MQQTHYRTFQLSCTPTRENWKVERHKNRWAWTWMTRKFQRHVSHSWLIINLQSSWIKWTSVSCWAVAWWLKYDRDDCFATSTISHTKLLSWAPRFYWWRHEANHREKPSLPFQPPQPSFRLSDRKKTTKHKASVLWAQIIFLPSLENKLFSLLFTAYRFDSPVNETKHSRHS